MIKIIAKRFYDTRFPDASLVLLNGSWAKNSANEDSDIDLLIIDPNMSDVLFEGVFFDSFLIDFCALSYNDVEKLFNSSIRYRSAPIPHQVVDSILILGNNDQADGIRNIARTVIDKGPAELSDAELGDLRWQLSTLLVELKHVSSNELPAMSAQCYILLAKTMLAFNRIWQGERKSLHRNMSKSLPEITERLDASLVASCNGDLEPLLDLGQEILQDIGGSIRTYTERYTL
jgi:hypothetical protein